MIGVAAGHGAVRPAAGHLHDHAVHHDALPGADPRRRLLPQRAGDDRRRRGRALVRGQRRHAPLVRGHRVPARAAEHDGRLPRRRLGGRGRPCGRRCGSDGPVYIRLGKKGEPLRPRRDPRTSRIGKAIVIAAGHGRLPAEHGNMLPTVLDAAERLARRRHLRRGRQLPHGQAARRGLAGRGLRRRSRRADGRGAQRPRRPRRQRRGVARRPAAGRGRGSCGSARRTAFLHEAGEQEHAREVLRPDAREHRRAVRRQMIPGRSVVWNGRGPTCMKTTAAVLVEDRPPSCWSWPTLASSTSRFRRSSRARSWSRSPTAGSATRRSSSAAATAARTDSCRTASGHEGSGIVREVGPGRDQGEAGRPGDPLVDQGVGRRRAGTGRTTGTAAR